MTHRPSTPPVQLPELACQGKGSGDDDAAAAGIRSNHQTQADGKASGAGGESTHEVYAESLQPGTAGGVRILLHTEFAMIAFLHTSTPQKLPG